VCYREPTREKGDLLMATQRRRRQKTDQVGSSAALPSLPAGLNIPTLPTTLSMPKTDPVWALIGLGTAGIACAVGLYWFSPAQQYYRAQQAEAVKVEADARLAQAKRDAEAMEGNRRYQEGCNMLAVTRPDGLREVINLSDATRYIDNASSSTLARGHVVCDDGGGTAIIGENGQVEPGSFRKASDMSLVNQRFNDALSWDSKILRPVAGADQ